MVATSGPTWMPSLPKSQAFPKPANRVENSRAMIQRWCESEVLVQLLALCSVSLAAVGTVNGQCWFCSDPACRDVS